MDKHLIKQFDAIIINTTKNVDFVSAPEGVNLSPHGAWSVICIVDKKYALVCKNGITCKVPIADITKIADYNPTKNSERRKNGEKQRKEG